MTYSAQIQTLAHDLLAAGTVDCVLGYEVGPRGRTRPAFIYSADETQRLAWNQQCTHNLTTYLPHKLRTKPGERAARVAIVVKPCDSRAINVLLAEQQIQREQVFIIGVACEGIVEGAGFGPPAEDTPLQARCQHCATRTPAIYDTLIGDPPAIEPIDEDSDLARLDAMPPAERLDFWLSQFDRCIRCYACRQACPMCNCPTCLYERDDSLWVGMGLGLNEKRAFHLGRAFHLAGRCIGCDECERVCPMDLPISLLNRKLAQTMQASFDYQAGMEAAVSPITTLLSGEEAAHAGD